jgi:hypothetical protein
VAPGSGDSFSLALAKVYGCVETYLDGHKEKAFHSAFLEPARLYFDIVGNMHEKDHVNIHAINWYLALLHGGLGVQLPLLSSYNDGDVIGVCDFWDGLTEKAWNLFKEEGNFGKAFEGILDFRVFSKRGAFKKRSLIPGQFANGKRHAKASHLGNVAAKGAPELATYLERYAHFFRRDWLARRMFENLNAESLPEYAGFRKACETLYRSYPLREADKETFVEFAYADEYFTELDVERVGEFFEWLKVLKERPGSRLSEARLSSSRTIADSPAEGPAARDAPREERTADVLGVLDRVLAENNEEAAAGVRLAVAVSQDFAEMSREFAEAVSRDGMQANNVKGKRQVPEDRTCPICMEEKDDVEMLEHWEPKGDVSEHKMCGACMAQWRQRENMECPFCRELLHADEMTEFIKDAVAAINHQQQMSPDEAAAIMEKWQMLEMMLQGQQSAIRRVAKLVVEHKDFVASITKGTSGKRRWLRDMAGVVFRLDSMYKDGELKVSAARGKMLADAVEALMTPIEGPNAQKLEPHFYGALYTQALTPWLCAWRGGASTRTAAEHVRRVGRSIAHGIKKHRINKKEITQRLVADYVMLSHEPVWGGQQSDVLYQAVYK